MHYMDKSSIPHTYKSFSDTKIHVVKLLAHSFCADVNAKQGLQICSY